VSIANNCEVSIVVGVGLSRAEAESAGSGDGERFVVEPADLVSVGMSTQPGEAFVVVFNPDLTVHAVTATTMVRDVDVASYNVEGDDCPSPA